MTWLFMLLGRVAARLAAWPNQPEYLKMSIERRQMMARIPKEED